MQSANLTLLLLMATANLAAVGGMGWNRGKQEKVWCDFAAFCGTINNESDTLAMSQTSARFKLTCKKDLPPKRAEHETQGIEKTIFPAWSPCHMEENPSICDFALPEVNFRSADCVAQFNEIAKMPMCGNELYDDLLHSVLLRFLNKDEKTSLDDEHNHVLVMLDGCALCDERARITGALVQFQQKAGSLFTTCSASLKQVPLFGRYKDAMGRDKEHDAKNKVEVAPSDSVDSTTTSFTFPFALFHRICKGVFSSDRVPQVYADPKLVVKHTCGGRNSELVLDLPAIDVSQGRIFEMRGLELNLNRNTVRQWRPVSTDSGVYERVEDPKWWNKYGLPIEGQIRLVQMDLDD